MQNSIPMVKSLGTHDGVFHADEVTACALLVLCELVDSHSIVRSRDPEVLNKCEFICDVGGDFDPQRKLFDHHQSDYEGSLSSAGMILEYLRDQKKFTSQEYQFLNDSVIHGVDLHDNGRSPTQFEGFCLFSHVVSNFNPVDYSATKEDRKEAFLEALDFVLAHLKRLLKRFNYIHSCESLVAKAMKEGGEVLFFEKTIPWIESFFELGGEKHEARFVVMPAGPHWKLRGIPPSWKNRMKVRLPLPLQWAGLLVKDLEVETGIKGAVFCHKERFTSVWETKDAALKALDWILKNE
jgi:uncharacterized UPF0160 family protein